MLIIIFCTGISYADILWPETEYDSFYRKNQPIHDSNEIISINNSLFPNGWYMEKWHANY